MRPELKRLILNARARLGGYALSTEQGEENARHKAIEDFQILLAGKIDISTRLELLFGAEYIGLEDRPAVRFQIDGHSFLITGGMQDCELMEQCSGQSLPLARLALADPNFEDRLLAVLGAA